MGKSYAFVAVEEGMSEAFLLEKHRSSGEMGESYAFLGKPALRKARSNLHFTILWLYGIIREIIRLIKVNGVAY